MVWLFIHSFNRFFSNIHATKGGWKITLLVVSILEKYKIKRKKSRKEGGKLFMQKCS